MLRTVIGGKKNWRKIAVKKDLKIKRQNSQENE